MTTPKKPTNKYIEWLVEWWLLILVVIIVAVFWFIITLIIEEAGGRILINMTATAQTVVNQIIPG